LGTEHQREESQANAGLVVYGALGMGMRDR